MIAALTSFGSVEAAVRIGPVDAAGPGVWVAAVDDTVVIEEETAVPETTFVLPEDARMPASAKDSSATGPGRRVSGAPPPRKPVSRWDQPKWVMMRSLVVPGWGQWHNKAWIKSVGVAAGEATLAYKIYGDRNDLDALQAEVDAARAAGDEDREDQLVTEYNERLDTYIGRQWFLGALVAYALLDAYIDAHFRSFRVEFEGDPALPGGVPPAKQLRLLMRWSF